MITTQDLAQMVLELKNSNLELKASGLRLEASQEKSDRRLDKVAKMMGNISNNQGDVAEEFFWNSLSATPTINGITYDYANKNAHKRIGNIEDEYDILLVNATSDRRSKRHYCMTASIF